ncbi:MAG: ABC transporter substrate-binding protein [candidate division Zixibacteria bacterium]|nr:ABC transporter substrate-binding protein [candidate division Zixibacteria bacterium]
MKRKLIRVMSLVFLFCATLYPLAIAADLEVKDLKLHFQPNAIFALHSVAIEKGWFQEAGFKTVEKKSFTAGALAGQALIAGEIHFWTPGNWPVISMRHNGVPVVIVGTLNAAPAEWLMVRDDAGVEKPEDLYKIKIATLVGSTCSGVIQNMADQYGLDPKKLQITNLAPPEQLTSLLANEVQAIMVWPPFSIKARKVATYRFNSLDFSNTLMPVVYSEDFIRKNPNAAKAVLNVLLRAQVWVRDPANKNEAISIHAKVSEQPAGVIEEAWDAFWNPKYPHGMVDQRFVDAFKNYTEFQASQGRIKDPKSVLTYLYTDFLEEVKPEFLQGIKGEWKP